MKFKLEIECDNDAFGNDDECQRNDEIARILEDAASRVSGACASGALRDSNGNKVGRFNLIPS